LNKTKRIKRKLRKTEKKLAELKKILSQLFPICAQCKKIRGNKDHWIIPEQFFRDLLKEHLEMQFSHGVCPKCLEKLYGDL